MCLRTAIVAGHRLTGGLDTCNSSTATAHVVAPITCGIAGCFTTANAASLERIWEPDWSTTA